MAVTTMIGAKIHRREDPRLVSGEGRFVDDFTRPGTAYMAVVRSPHAHARIKSIDLTAAYKNPVAQNDPNPVHEGLRTQDFAIAQMDRFYEDGTIIQPCPGPCRAK